MIDVRRTQLVRLRYDAKRALHALHPSIENGIHARRDESCALRLHLHERAQKGQAFQDYISFGRANIYTSVT